jgi:3-hydroxyanthranilate 3,4-dioxygenase
MTTKKKKVNLIDLVSSVESTLKPPVSNIMIFNDKLKFMIVGGPNQREDYHIQTGEEIFYQLKGFMDLCVMECGVKKEFRIREGEIFLLPSGVPHSPKRYANSIGLVFERERYKHQIDSLRWYNADSNTIFYEEFFHCVDLGTQIKKAIENFNNKLTSNCSNLKGNENSTQSPEIQHLLQLSNESKLTPINPFNLLTALNSTNNNTKMLSLFDSEFQVNCIIGPLIHDVYHAPIDLYSQNEWFLWQITGTSTITLKKKNENNNIKQDNLEEENFILETGEISLVKMNNDNNNNTNNLNKEETLEVSSIEKFSVEASSSNDVLLIITNKSFF